MASAANGGGTKIIAVLAPVASTASATRVEDRHAVDLGAPLARGHPGDQVGAVVAIAERVEPALPAGEALDDQAGGLVDVDRPSLGYLPPARRPCSAASRMVAAGTTVSDAAPRRGSPGPPRRWCRRGGPRSATGSSRLVERLDDPLGHQVAAGDPAEDVDQHRPDRPDPWVSTLEGVA